MAKKYYAVRNGRKNGIFESWPECQSSVTGFPDAEYKSFKTRDEASAYLENREAPQPQAQAQPETPEGYDCIIYTDGSYRKDLPDRFTGASVTLNGEGRPIYKAARLYIDPEMAKMNNVAGEVMAAALALYRAHLAGMKRVALYHDYKGVAYWNDPDPAYGKPWKAQNKYTRSYQALVAELRQDMVIDFYHVEGHSGNKWNDMVDGFAAGAFHGGRNVSPDTNAILELEHRIMG